ncbi:uncharacterized protein LOC135840299 [Planococcus citri]|uniref:uncharacterized protein LOC135840299 n=1 Tax=Planococcus citri TaxID=170843 RepID=UPI0031F7FB49
MTETVSNVYDLLYPSPITLKQISSIIVAVQLWRTEIRDHPESKRFQDFDSEDNIPVRTVLPTLPSTIYSLLEKYIDTFRKSVVKWQNYHKRVFNDSGSMIVLSRFNDFAWDWDGTIHEERTAKRMMMCDRLTVDEKFQIACLYCFENDIKHLWQSVSKTKHLNEMKYRNSSLQYYWICYLRNKLHRIPNPFTYDDIDNMYEKRGFKNRSSVVYFWNRLSSDRQPRIDVYSSAVLVFCRFILPKLNEQQLDIFVAEKGVKLMHFLLEFRSTQFRDLVLPTWKYIQSRIDAASYSYLINEMLVDETMKSKEHVHSGRGAVLFSEIWKSAPQEFKRSALDVVLHNEIIILQRNHTRLNTIRSMKLLNIVLQDAALEERNAFWCKNWPKLIFSAPVEDLDVAMKLSFRSENEITLFKENTMSIYENMAEGCVLLLKFGDFKELNDFLSFCCLDEQKRVELKQRLLSSNYIGENSVFTRDVVRNNKLLNEFVDDAFRDAADLGVEFRNQLTSSPVTEECLLECIRWCHVVDVVHLMEFVDTFIADEQVIVPLKKRLFEHFKDRLIAGNVPGFDSDKFEAFVVWLLGSEDEIIRFKQSISVVDIVHNAMRILLRVLVIGSGAKLGFPTSCEDFLMWYYNKDEDEIEKFMNLLDDELMKYFFIVPREHLTNRV